MAAETFLSLLLKAVFCNDITAFENVFPKAGCTAEFTVITDLIIMYLTVVVFILALDLASAFPFVAEIPGVDSSLLRKASSTVNEKRQSSCPFNSVHPGAAPYNAEYPYTGARNGLPGTGKGGLLVPAPGDTAHAFQAPGPNDIRGPCPGLNTAANHHVRYSFWARFHSY